MITVLTRREFRTAMDPRVRDELRQAAAALAGDLMRASWVTGLTLVLDDEPLIALDPASG